MPIDTSESGTEPPFVRDLLDRERIAGQSKQYDRTDGVDQVADGANQ